MKSLDVFWEEILCESMVIRMLLRSTTRMLMASEVFLTSMCCFVLAQSNKSAKVCLDPRNTVTYTCEANQMIHVINVLYQGASDDCEVPADACEVKVDNLSNGLTTRCNGEVTCNDDLSTFMITRTCENITTALGTVSYECTTEPAVNVCDTTIVSSGNTDTLYMTSPNYPEPHTHSSTESTCECNITGTDMSVEILEINFLFNPSLRANLTLTGDTSSWKSHPNTFLAYNLNAINKDSNLHVVFDAYSRTRQRMWMRIKGTSTLMVICNGGSPATTVNSTVPTGISTPDPSPSSIEISTTRSSTVCSGIASPGILNTSAIIGALCGVIVILLLAVAALVIYIKYVKPRRLLMAKSLENQANGTQLSQNETQNTSDNSPAGYADIRHYGNIDNVYTGLDAQGNQSPAIGNSYSHLQTYANDDIAHDYCVLRNSQDNM